MTSHDAPPAGGGRLLVGNGKQALALTARRLRALGVRCALLPSYRCATMALPFTLEGIRVRDVACGGDLLMDAGALEAALTVEPGAAVVHCETYGARARGPLQEALARAGSSGSVLVLDASHSLLDRPRLLGPGLSLGAGGSVYGGTGGTSGDGRAHRDRETGGDAQDGPGWDVVVASLRKTLPVPDGAVLVWISGGWTSGWEPAAQLVERGGADDASTGLGAELGTAVGRMRAAARALAGARFETAHLEVCRVAEQHEEAVASALSPVPASAVTEASLARVTAREVARRRRAARVARSRVAAALPTGGPLSLLAAPWSGGLAVTGRLTALQALSEGLAAHGLWGPVLWDGSDAGRGSRPLTHPERWPGGLVAPGRAPGARTPAGGGAGGTEDGWPLVVTLPTDQPERLEEEVGLVVDALRA